MRKNLLIASLLAGLALTEAISATVRTSKRGTIQFNTNAASRKRKTNGRKARATAKRRAKRNRKL